MAMIQQSYPAEELGRILGVLNSLLSLARPIGLIFAGPLADLIGIERLFVICRNRCCHLRGGRGVNANYQAI